MKRAMLLILSIFLLTAQAEEIDSPLVHAEEYYSPTITFQTDEAGVFAVVVLSTLSPAPAVTPDQSITPAPSEEPEIVEGTEELETEETEEPAFLINCSFSSHSITYTLTPIGETTP